jgi:hypothetical protein
LKAFNSGAKGALDILGIAFNKCFQPKDFPDFVMAKIRLHKVFLSTIN